MQSNEMNCVQVQHLYRHFKGDYYLILSRAFNEADKSIVVVYQNIITQQIWVRPETQFFDPVPEGKPNPTNQKHRFELMGVNRPLSTFKTAALEQELAERKALNVSDSWRTEYLVGKVKTVFIDKDTSFEDFDVDTVHNTFDEAYDRLLKIGSTDYKIMKRVYDIVDI